MGILDRLGRTLKSNINSFIDKAEDPAKIIAQTIEDMGDELKKARQEVVSALASQKTLERKAREQLEDAAGWERKAMLALEHGDEELAREGLKRKKKAEADAVESERLHTQQVAYVTELRSTIDQLEKKVEELKAKKATLASQVSRARSEAGNTEVGGNNAGAIGRLKGLQDRIESMEAEVEAQDILVDPKKVDLEERFRRLERGESPAGGPGGALDDELAALKARLKNK
jgi:phage shock protein A